MFTRLKAALQALALCIAAFAISFVFPAFAVAQSNTAETFGVIQKILAVVPDWVQVLTLFSMAFSGFAAITPPVKDDEYASKFKKFVAKLRRLVDILGLSVGNANKQGKK